MSTGEDHNQSPRRPAGRHSRHRPRRQVRRLAGLAAVVALVVITIARRPELITTISGPGAPPPADGPTTIDPNEADLETAGPEPARRPGLGPPAPTGVTADGGDGAVTIAWVPPPEGRQPVSCYQVQIVDEPQRVRSAGTETNLHWTGLANATPFRFRVRAVSSDGWGPWSEPSEAATPSS
jgi:hypothetical protein